MVRIENRSSVLVSCFQVMVQPHNRHMSFSLYILALAVTDSVTLLVSKYFSLSGKWITSLNYPNNRVDSRNSDIRMLLSEYVYDHTKSELRYMFIQTQ